MRVFLSMAVLCLVISGCGSVVAIPGSISSPAPVTSASSTPPSSKPITVPKIVTGEPFAGAQAVMDEDSELLHQAIEREIVTCMKGKGFKYTPAPFIPREKQALGRLGDLDYAAKEGFGLDFEDQTHSVVTDNPDMRGMSQAEIDEFMRAFGGNATSGSGAPEDELKIPSNNGTGEMRISKSGCRGDAIRKVAGDFDTWFIDNVRLEEMVQQVNSDLNKDPQFVKARSVWEGCMKDAGFGTKSVQEHSDDLRSQYKKKKLSLSAAKTTEIQIAKASATCDQQANLPQLYGSLLAQYEAKAEGANAGYVLAMAERRQQMSAKIKQGR